MDKRLKKIVTAAGAAVIGLVLVQPASAQRDSALVSNQLTGAFGASAAHTSCDALQGQSHQDCLVNHSSPSVTDGAFTGRFARDSASAGASASAPSDRIPGYAGGGADPAKHFWGAAPGG